MTQTPAVLLINTSKVEPVKALEAMTDRHLVVVTEPRYRDLYSPETEVHVVDDVNDFKTVLRVTLGVLRDRNVHAVLTPSERSVPVGGYLRSTLGLPGIEFEVANRFSNKLVMKDAFEAAGIPHVPYAALRHLRALPEVAARLGWPVMVKPVFGAGGVDSVVFRSPSEYERFLASDAAARYDDFPFPLLAEAYTTVTAEYHCDAIVVDGQCELVSAARYFDPLFGRDFTLRGSHVLPEGELRERLLHLHDQVVTSLGLRSGITQLEVLATDDGLVAGEVACRPGGGGVVEAAALQFGVDYWDAWLDISLGNRPKIEPERRPGVVVLAMLPARPGVIRRLTEAPTLAALPWVEEVTMERAVGDVIAARAHSSFVTGLVFGRVPDESYVGPFRAAIEDAYVIETDPAR